MNSLKRISTNIIFTLLLILTSTTAQAELLTASLNHDGDVKLFYGETALIDALEAAQPNDWIILNRGKFTAPASIDKAVKIQGVGAEATKIENGNSNVKINIPESQSGLWLEGLGFSYGVSVTSALTDATFRNCKMPYSFPLGSNRISGCEIFQCWLDGGISGDGEFENLYIHNCIIRTDAIKGNAIIDRCIIRQFGSRYGNHSIKNSIMTSETVSANGAGYATTVVTERMNFINVICPDKWTFDDEVGCENVIQLPSKEIKALFKSTINYELTEAAAATYQMEGSEIGAYGGNTPYTLDSTIPRITKATVPSVVPADGNLKISFTIETSK